jgi:hypothetical protein
LRVGVKRLPLPTGVSIGDSISLCKQLFGDGEHRRAGVVCLGDGDQVVEEALVELVHLFAQTRQTVRLDEIDLGPWSAVPARILVTRDDGEHAGRFRGLGFLARRGKLQAVD